MINTKKMKIKLYNSKSELSVVRHCYTRADGVHVYKIRFDGSPFSHHKHYTGFYDVELTKWGQLANGLTLPFTVRIGVFQLLAGC